MQQTFEPTQVSGLWLFIEVGSTIFTLCAFSFRPIFRGRWERARPDGGNVRSRPSGSLGQGSGTLMGEGEPNVLFKQKGLMLQKQSLCFPTKQDVHFTQGVSLVRALAFYCQPQKRIGCSIDSDSFRAIKDRLWSYAVLSLCFQLIVVTFFSSGGWEFISGEMQNVCSQFLRVIDRLIQSVSFAFVQPARLSLWVYDLAQNKSFDPSASHSLFFVVKQCFQRDESESASAACSHNVVGSTWMEGWKGRRTYPRPRKFVSFSYRKQQ